MAMSLAEVPTNNPKLWVSLPHVLLKGLDKQVNEPRVFPLVCRAFNAASKRNNEERLDRFKARIPEFQNFTFSDLIAELKKILINVRLFDGENLPQIKDLLLAPESYQNLRRWLTEENLIRIAHTIGDLSAIVRNLNHTNAPREQILKEIRNFLATKTIEIIDFDYVYYGLLTEIPDEIFKIRRLRLLYLRGNRIEQIPASIKNCTDLERLDLRFNKVSEVPEELLSLKKLYRLDLGDNNLRTFPRAILPHPRLEDIQLDSNGITDIPRFQPGNLPKLRMIRLQYNRLPYFLTPRSYEKRIKRAYQRDLDIQIGSQEDNLHRKVPKELKSLLLMAAMVLVAAVVIRNRDLFF